MNFLIPSALVGLVAVVIPVILHFLFRRNPRIIPFPTLRFIKILQSRDIRKLRIRELLLLILRMLILLFLVLIFSRPAFQTASGWLKNHGSDGLILLVVDDSASMAGEIDGISRFSLGLKKLAETIEQFDENQEVWISTLSNLADSMGTIQKDISGNTIRFLEKLKPSNFHLTLSDGLRGLLARKIQQAFPSKELFFFTDGQDDTFTYDEKTEDLLKKHFFGWEISVIQLPEIEQNISLQNLQNSTKVYQIGREIHPSITVVNHGLSPVEQIPVQFWIDSVRAGVDLVNLNPGASENLDFFWKITTTGWHTGYFEIPKDAFELDNRIDFAFYVPRKINVAILSEEEDETEFLKATFRASVNQLQQFTTSEQIDKTTDVAIICTPPKNIIVLQKQIEQLLERNGALLVFASGNNSFIDWLKLGKKPVQKQSGIPLRSEYLEHEIFQNLLYRESESVETPKISRYYQFKNPIHGDVFATLENGVPFWIEQEKMIFINTSVDLQWSDFALTGAFAPLIQRAIHYLTGTKKSVKYLIAGEKLIMESKNNQKISLIQPNGKVIVNYSNEKTKWQTTMPGIYFLTKNEQSDLGHRGDFISAFSAQIDNMESALIFLTNSTKKRWGDVASIHFYKQESVEEIVHAARFGIELWRPLLFVVLVLLTLEFFISRSDRKHD
ncbi:MAG: BatA domain-containing protein [Candidatus Marinimicrobia bacterium]|nr:BatA domain-containing protein [Candidatus Neomarinimicrobiota bacterium]